MKTTLHRLQSVKQTWTYNHKHLLITLSLATALICHFLGDLVPLPNISLADEIVAVNEALPEQGKSCGEDMACWYNEWESRRIPEIIATDPDSIAMQESIQKHAEAKAKIEFNEKFLNNNN